MAVTERAACLPSSGDVKAEGSLCSELAYATGYFVCLSILALLGVLTFGLTCDVRRLAGVVVVSDCVFLIEVF